MKPQCFLQTPNFCAVLQSLNMASSPANFVYSTVIKRHFRVFLIPLVKRNSLLCCARGREYCSSFPVKYIPKKCSISENFEPASSRVKNLVEQEKHDSLDMNVPGVNSFSNSCWRVPETEPKNHVYLQAGEDKEDDFIAVNEEFTEDFEYVGEDYSNIFQAGQSQQDVEKSAIELLASRRFQGIVNEIILFHSGHGESSWTSSLRCHSLLGRLGSSHAYVICMRVTPNFVDVSGAFTALELKKKLRRKRFALEVVDALIMDFQRRGLINDRLYAETFARSRWSSLSWGPRRIKQELFKKGVNEVDAEKAIKLVFENDGASEDQDSGLAMSKLSIDLLLVQASKQWTRSQAVPCETRKSRIVRWLQYRGYSWSVTKFILKKLESECP